MPGKQYKITKLTKILVKGNKTCNIYAMNSREYKRWISDEVTEF